MVVFSFLDVRLRTLHLSVYEYGERRRERRDEERSTDEFKGG